MYGCTSCHIRLYIAPCTAGHVIYVLPLMGCGILPVRAFIHHIQQHTTTFFLPKYLHIDAEFCKFANWKPKNYLRIWKNPNSHIPACAHTDRYAYDGNAADILGDGTMSMPSSTELVLNGVEQPSMGLVSMADDMQIVLKGDNVLQSIAITRNARIYRTNGYGTLILITSMLDASAISIDDAVLTVENCRITASGTAAAIRGNRKVSEGGMAELHIKDGTSLYLQNRSGMYLTWRMPSSTMRTTERLP